MISVSDATRLVLSCVAARRQSANQHRATPTPTPTPISLARSGVSAQDILADLDFPPFDRVMMDGIAIRSESYAQGHRTFTVEGTQAAGVPALELVGQTVAIEVMTGAVLPRGADAVVRYEDLIGGREISQFAQVSDDLVIVPGLNIHRSGTDARKGQVLVRAGATMGPAQWGVAASVGLARVSLTSQPKILLVATGDELCEVSETPAPHQIRMSNVYAIAAALRDRGFEDVRMLHLADDPAAMMDALRDEVATTDLCVFTGAVSAGRFDHLPAVLREFGVDEIFHGVAQKPGKPLWFGQRAGGSIVFGLPGNPLSALIGTFRYVIPAAQEFMGIGQGAFLRFAELSATIELGGATDLTRYVPVLVSYGTDARTFAKPLSTSCSGDMVSVLESDGFIECQPGRSVYEIGTRCPLYLWRPS